LLLVLLDADNPTWLPNAKAFSDAASFLSSFLSFCAHFSLPFL